MSKGDIAAQGQLDRGVRRRGNTMTGFVLVTPCGDVMAETFRSTRDAAKGWIAMLKMGDGRYHDWKHYYRQGWRCKPASLTLDEPSNCAIEGPEQAQLANGPSRMES